jgi:hypothetical protein
MPGEPRPARNSTTRPLPIEALESLKLVAGAHQRRSRRAVCVMEAVAWVAGERHSDHPECASPTIATLLRSWNDALNDQDRQMLKPLIPRLVGTRGTPEQEMQRSWMALDWYCRVSAPTWLRAAGLAAEAVAIETTAPITDSASATAAQEALNRGCRAAYAAWAAVWAAAGAAVWDAARAAVGAAAGDAARAAAGGAARAAARAAAGAAVWDAARAAVGAAAGAAVWDARAAARAALRPTVEVLQRSAIELVERMIALSEPRP